MPNRFVFDCRTDLVDEVHRSLGSTPLDGFMLWPTTLDSEKTALLGWSCLAPHPSSIHELSLRTRGKDAQGKRTFDHKVGDDLFKLTGKYNHLERRIDWRENRYFEKVIDGETGEVIAYKNEPLSDHRGHGSAKKKEGV